jgi:hypothetical protein
MRSASPSGGAGVSVERFICALSLSCLPVAGGWIVSRGENGQSGGGRAVPAEVRDLGAKGAGNAAKQIFALLFSGRKSLVFNVFSALLDTFSGSEAGGQVVIGGGWAASKQGGRGSRAARASGPYNPSTAAKFVPIVRVPKIGLQKREGRGRLLTTTQHGTQL